MRSASLKDIARQQKLSHAYLFSGNNTAQKHQLTEELLQILRVENADCTRVASEEERGSAEITIAQIRQLANFFSVSAWHSPCKVAILHDAHVMNAEAQSAFLKLLEEPKGNALLFLHTAHPDMLLDTIRSRAQEIKFYSFAPASVSEAALQEFQNLHRADLITRFAAARKLAESPNQLSAILHEWLLAGRQLLRGALENQPQNARSLTAALQTIQETKHLLETTNVNPRLALEHIMLAL